MLRAFEERDAEELDAVVQANREHLARRLPWVETTGGPADRLGFIRRARAQQEAGDGFQAAIVDGGAIVGAIGFHAVDRAHRATSIGYWLAADRQGRGIVTQAAAALVDHAFGALGLHRVEIRVATGNRRSAAIPERLGFTREGVLREAERFGERYEDLVVYGLLAREWRGRPR